MRIDANSELPRASKIPATTPSRKTATKSNTVDLARTEALNAALNATPEVRADQVARAKALIQDPGYPLAKVVDQVAGVLAKRIRSKEL
jgi:hypothetical protein